MAFNCNIKDNGSFQFVWNFLSCPKKDWNKFIFYEIL